MNSPYRPNNRSNRGGPPQQNQYPPQQTYYYGAPTPAQGYMDSQMAYPYEYAMVMSPQAMYSPYTTSMPHQPMLQQTYQPQQQPATRIPPQQAMPSKKISVKTQDGKEVDLKEPVDIKKPATENEKKLEKATETSTASDGTESVVPETETPAVVVAETAAAPASDYTSPANTAVEKKVDGPSEKTEPIEKSAEKPSPEALVIEEEEKTNVNGSDVEKTEADFVKTEAVSEQQTRIENEKPKEESEVAEVSSTSSTPDVAAEAATPPPRIYDIEEMKKLRNQIPPGSVAFAGLNIPSNYIPTKPSYQPKQPSNRGQQQKGSKASSPKVGAQPKQIPLLPPVKPLVHSENRWKSTAGQKLDPMQVKFRTVKGILNKITVETFDELSKDILALNIETENEVKGVIKIIFDKALDEPNFGYLYAQLCTILNDDFKKKMDAGGPDTIPDFRRLLLNRCQEEFEQDDQPITIPEEQKKGMTEEQINEELEFLRLKMKRKKLGNITFIGELYKLDMLSEKIIHEECVKKLLADIKNPEERDIECLCNLLKTVGKKLDHAEAEKPMKLYFDRMRKLTKLEVLPPRIRFMVQDVIDLRENKWVPRREELKGKKLGDIKSEVQQEPHRQPSGRGSRPSGGSDRRSSGRQGMPTLAEQGADISQIEKYKITSGNLQPKTSEIYLGPPSKSQKPVDVKPDEKEEKEEKPSESKSSEKSAEYIENKTKSLFEEYNSSNDLKEAVACVKDLLPSKYSDGIVHQLITITLDTKDSDRKNAAKIIAESLKSNVLAVSDVGKGMKETLENLEDLKTDIPKVNEYFGSYFVHLFLERALPLNFINNLADYSDTYKYIIKGLEAEWGEEMKKNFEKEGVVLKI